MTDEIQSQDPSDDQIRDIAENPPHPESHENQSGEALAHVAHGDTTVFMGKTYNIPIYSSVYIALGAFTILEVTIAEIISSDVKIPLLLGFAIAKSLLVVMFYMHLKQDSRIFALALAVPLGIALLSMLFLLAVPATGY
jgi:cytochrome c oxidase subunit 4